jgi:hypothetical protein
MSRRFRAPTANGAVLADPPFDALPALVEANQRLLNRAHILIDGVPLDEFRAEARREVLNRAGAGPIRDAEPLVVTGHQPELSHPGVWVKNFALNALARRLGGVPLNLIVDNDTLKSTTLRFPTFRAGDPSSVRLESVAFDVFTGEEPYESRTIRDTKTFCAFLPAALALTRNWGYRPLLADAWRDIDPSSSLSLGEQFAAVRQRFERKWGCHNVELQVSELSGTRAFARFASHILTNLGQFRAVYNAAIQGYREVNGIRSRNHPAPELAEGEAPFWMSGRSRATATSDVSDLRPRALTLTLFARVCLGDFFIHGIGGGKYDEVTNAIIRGFFGIEPPAYQVLSATLHLPLPGFPGTATALHRAERRIRDLQWNPHQCLRPEQYSDVRTRSLLDAHAALSAAEPPYANHAQRRAWFRDLQAVKEQLRLLVVAQLAGAEEELRCVRTEVSANAILQRRDFAWVLYPEETLQPFLTGLSG